MCFYGRKAKSINVLSIILVIILITFTTAIAQDLRNSVFQKTDKALKQATDAQAEYLSPKNFVKAVELYNKADKDFNKGKNLESIRKRLQEAEKYFIDALAASRLAQTTFASVLKAKSDAESVKSKKYAVEPWTNAGEKFKAAAEKLESGDLKNARKKGAEAENFYREAELITVKAIYLDETRQLLDKADAIKVKKYAPKTLKRARELLQTAEIELERNRYDIDYPRSLARQAKYEVKHSLFLAEAIQKLKEEKASIEDILLLGESPLEEIASMAGIVAEFDAGFGKVKTLITEFMNTQEETIITTKQELVDQKRETLLLQQSVASLNEQLGGIQKEKSALAKEKSVLAQKIEAERIIKEKYSRIGKIFTKSEARVLRTPENDLILRLIGLNFQTGKSEIKSEYFNLLVKVKQAIEIFPKCRLRIEGHTDSHGGDQLNMELSQKRADAVKSYFMANMNISASRIKAVGFGETHPIGNNDTKRGLSKNRRIDVILITQ